MWPLSLVKISVSLFFLNKHYNIAKRVLSPWLSSDRFKPFLVFRKIVCHFALHPKFKLPEEQGIEGRVFGLKRPTISHVTFWGEIKLKQRVRTEIPSVDTYT